MRWCLGDCLRRAVTLLAGQLQWAVSECCGTLSHLRAGYFSTPRDGAGMAGSGGLSSFGVYDTGRGWLGKVVVFFHLDMP